MAFNYTFRTTDIRQFDTTTADLLDNRDNEIELYLQLADPIGRICTWHTGVTVPDGWLSCNGASKSTLDYPGLFAVIGYTYGGSGTSFTLPTVTNGIIRY